MLIKNLLSDSRQITDSLFLICEMGTVVLCNTGEVQGTSQIQARCLIIEVPKKARKNSSKNTFYPTAFLMSGPLKNHEYSVFPLV